MITALQALANLEAVLNDTPLDKISIEIISSWVKTIAAALDERDTLLEIHTNWRAVAQAEVESFGSITAEEVRQLNEPIKDHIIAALAKVRL